MWRRSGRGPTRCCWLKQPDKHERAKYECDFFDKILREINRLARRSHCALKCKQSSPCGIALSYRVTHEGGQEALRTLIRPSPRLLWVENSLLSSSAGSLGQGKGSHHEASGSSDNMSSWAIQSRRRPDSSNSYSFCRNSYRRPRLALVK
jgi:hypothetical protein